MLYDSDYNTYKEIMGELLNPIEGYDLDDDTLTRLYESKLIYLENLRTKCFKQINSSSVQSSFTTDDYNLIMEAISNTRAYIRGVVLNIITKNITKSS